MSMATKLGRMPTNHEELSPTFDIVVFLDNLAN